MRSSDVEVDRTSVAGPVEVHHVQSSRTGLDPAPRGFERIRRVLLLAGEVALVSRTAFPPSTSTAG